MNLPDHFTIDFDMHIFAEKLVEITKREGRNLTPEEAVIAASESIMPKTSGKPMPLESNNDRAYHTELIVLETLMQYQAKLTTGTYNTQERARIADASAKEASKKIREYWEREK